MSDAPLGVYPLSTAQSLAIPYDVAAPISLVKAYAAGGVPTAITLPASNNLCSVYFEKDVIIFTGIPGAVTDNVVTPAAYYCKGGVIAELYLPKDINIQGVVTDSAGYINILVPWVQMNNTTAYGVS